ncbi:MAG: anaerobic ribonucleoside-triphosphate reductase activating protein [Candidatus Micrarchaeia archaeon]
MNFEIKGFLENTLLDFPGKIASVVFTPKCNFKCPYCQNPALVLHPESEPSVDPSEILDYLAKPDVKKWVDGVCVTGGEPCLQQDLPLFLRELKQLGYAVKLDTNGSKPAMLEELFNKKLLDYVAMDVKAPLEEYDEVAKAEVNKEDLQKSVDVIRKSGADYEFRTTVVPGFFNKQKAMAIGQWLQGSKRFFLQQFRSVVTLDPSLQGKRHFHKDELEEFQKTMRPFFEEVGVRGA